MNGFGRDRFEMLSAYLDGEATAQERQQVQQWLDTDPQAQCLYQRIIKLRSTMNAMPVPQGQSPDCVTQGVFRRLRQRSWQQAALVGGGAIAAVFVSVVSGVFPGNNGAWQYAETPSSPEISISEDSLAIAINRPVVEIPKAAIAPEKMP
ncbi:MAG: Fis family transcriptional regulator [Jaaginema sp. PMC 1079.18]|nr:Fis family transcriptional regulator [Jaaginema sp. PMC 1080.18]MEC4852090.1 Fis family transcriptional regulator [Jaaginema sp. PMC 1079.18]MEC4868274.1 Fis family transcriptional regulator [Jaaginema sp. PMC 1078.18]